MEFNRAFELLIGHEGGYTDDRRDPGNWTGGKVGSGRLLGTKYGIAANSYPNLDIKNLTVEDARAIYKRDYWNKCRCDELPPAARFQVFDMAVNAGNSRSIKLLQKTVGVAQDGSIGPQTMAAVHAMDGAVMNVVFGANRLEFYASLGTWGTFGKGWTRRVASSLKQSVLN